MVIELACIRGFALKSVHFLVDMPSAFLAKPFSKEISMYKWPDMNSGAADSAGAAYRRIGGGFTNSQNKKGQRKEN